MTTAGTGVGAKVGVGLCVAVKAGALRQFSVNVDVLVGVFIIVGEVVTVLVGV